jgi:glycosyltransferase involved in cell wall biosynthesis
MDLAEGLLERDCDVHLIYSPRRMDKFFAHRLSKLRALKSVPLPMRRSIHPGDFAMVRGVRRYLREFGPFDVIHGHSSKGGALARLTALGTRAAAFYTLHGLIMMDPDHCCRASGRLRRRFCGLSFSRCAASITSAC